MCQVISVNVIINVYVFLSAEIDTVDIYAIKHYQLTTGNQYIHAPVHVRGCKVFFVSPRFASRIHVISDLKPDPVLSRRSEQTRFGES